MQKKSTVTFVLLPTAPAPDLVPAAGVEPATFRSGGDVSMIRRFRWSLPCSGLVN
jgi:hypothetical protein